MKKILRTLLTFLLFTCSCKESGREIDIVGNWIIANPDKSICKNYIFTVTGRVMCFNHTPDGNRLPSDLSYGCYTINTNYPNNIYTIEIKLKKQKIDNKFIQNNIYQKWNVAKLKKSRNIIFNYKQKTYHAQYNGIDGEH